MKSDFKTAENKLHNAEVVTTVLERIIGSATGAISKDDNLYGDFFRLQGRVRSVLRQLQDLKSIVKDK